MEKQLETMTFGKGTVITIEYLRGWSFAKFEKLFTEAFQREYNSEPDFDLRVAYNAVQARSKQTGVHTPEETPKTGIHKK